ncbi:MAG: bifunctional metallophosphatase/5'-nucleotidase [Candidatus Delongbacteria bacterium]|nr:bifunctional metallophosphatase/5'-nucleotidase [Candidatus Delongbacteria bacterium]
MKNIVSVLMLSILFFSCFKQGKDLTVVSTSSLNGNIFPVEKDGVKSGGFSLISSAVKKITGENSTEVELIGNSNFIYGTKESYFTTGQAVIDLMNELNYSCLIIGHREFYFGFDELEKLSKRAKFPFISANIEFKDSCRISFLKPYIILKDNRSAVIGISTEKVLKANLEKDVGSIRIKDPADAIEFYIKELRSKGIENIIVAGDFDCDENSISNLTQDQIRRVFSIKEVDLFLTTTEKNKLCSLSKIRPVLNCSINGFEAVSFKVGDKGIYGSERHRINSVELDPDTDLSAKMSEINQIIDSVTGKVLGSSTEDIFHSQGDKFVTETPLGNLISDIMRDFTGTDIFLMNSGKVRNGFEKGPINFGDLYNVIPYEGSIVTVEMTGEQIIKILESSCAFKMSKSFLQVSGIKFSFNSSKEPFSRVIENTVRINGKPLDKSRLYSVSLTDYIYQGGDSYNEFADMEVKLIKIHQKQMREIIKDHIISVSKIQTPENSRITDISKL